MPPKKKARLPSLAASTPSIETPAESHPVASNNETPAKGDEDGSKNTVTDPWTDEQEISLFKGMIKWKPVGMHKHFRMLSISQHLRNHGHNPKENPHTRIPGIWKKLDSLYNMKVLDEREDSLVELGYDENDPRKEPFVPFKLPTSEFEDLMFARRLAPPGSSSPPSLPHQMSSESVDGRSRPSVIDDSEEPRSSPASNRGAKSTRARRGMRRSQLHEESTPTGRSASKASVDASGDGDDAEEEDDADENDSEEEDAPSTPARGGRGGYRPGRGARGGRWRTGRRGGRRR